MVCEIIKIGDATAIVCGAPADHECNMDGQLLILSTGERIVHTDEYFKEHFNEIVGGSMYCTICGRAAIDEFMNIDI